MKASKYELKPLLYSIIPIALLATWAFSRVAYVPPRAGQDLQVLMFVRPTRPLPLTIMPTFSRRTALTPPIGCSG